MQNPHEPSVNRVSPEPSYWLGPLRLKNPLVVASSPATEDMPRLRRCAAAGAGAAILKSCHTLFWTPPGKASTGRQFQSTSRGLWGTSNVARELLSPHAARTLLANAMGSLPMPVIPSIAGSTLEPGPWLETLRLFEPLNPECVQLDLFYLQEDISLSVTQQRLAVLVHTLRNSSPLPLLPKLNQELRPGAALATLGGTDICGWSLLDSLRFCVPPPGTTACGTFPDFDCASPYPTASLFGPFQFPTTLDYLIKIRNASPLPILAGGGANSVDDCILLLKMGASAIQVATPILRHGSPWIAQAVTEIATALHKAETSRSHHNGAGPLRIFPETCQPCTGQMMCEAFAMGANKSRILKESCERCGFCAGTGRDGLILIETTAKTNQ